MLLRHAFCVWSNFADSRCTTSELTLNLFIVFHAEACPRCACCIGRSTYQEPPPASNDQLRAFKRAEQLMKRQIREQWYDLSKEVKRRGEACNSSALSTEDQVEQTHCSLTVIIKATSGVSLLA